MIHPRRFGPIQWKEKMSYVRENNKFPNYLRIENGGGYFSNAFKNYCNRFGIKHEKVFLGTPRHNGIVERMNNTIMEKLSMLQIMDWKRISR